MRHRRGTEMAAVVRRGQGAELGQGAKLPGQGAELGQGELRDLRREAERGAVGRAAVVRWAGAAWRYLREVSGDDAYERYLAHCAAHHAGEKPMSPKDYFAERQRQKWSGVTRCC